MKRVLVFVPCKSQITIAIFKLNCDNQGIHFANFGVVTKVDILERDLWDIRKFRRIETRTGKPKSDKEEN
jgi:hypothetical protein